MVIGFAKTARFFAQPKRWKGTVAFFLGVVMVLFRYVKTGMLIEAFGFINLFGYLGKSLTGYIEISSR